MKRFLESEKSRGFFFIPEIKNQHCICNLSSQSDMPGVSLNASTSAATFSLPGGVPATVKPSNT